MAETEEESIIRNRFPEHIGESSCTRNGVSTKWKEE